MKSKKNMNNSKWFSLKGFLKYFFPLVLVVFSIACFLGSLNPSRKHVAESPTIVHSSQSSNHFVLQNPTYDEKYSKWIASDSNNASLPRVQAGTITDYHVNKLKSGNPYLDPSHKYNLEIKMKILTADEKWLTGLSGAKFTYLGFKLSTHSGFISASGGDPTEWKRTIRTGGSTSDKGSASHTYNFPLKIKASPNINDPISSFSIDPDCSKFWGAHIADSGLEYYQLKDLTTNKTIISKSFSLDISNPLANGNHHSYANWIHANTDSTYHPISFPGKFYTTENHKTSFQRSVTADPIILDSDTVNSKSLSQSEMKSLLHFYLTDSGHSATISPSSAFVPYVHTKLSSALLSPSTITYENLVLDKYGKRITGTISYKFTSGSYSSKMNFSIPINVVSFRGLLQGSTTSGTDWKHSSDGGVKYWAKSPTTEIKLSNDYIRALYILGKQKSVSTKVSSDSSWGWIGSDKNTALDAIKNNSLNYWNYDEVKSKYISSRSASTFSSLQPPDYLSEMKSQNSWSTNLDLRPYLIAFKLASTKITQVVNGTNYYKTIPLSQVNQLAKFTISGTETRLKINEGRVVWAPKYKYSITGKNSNTLLKSQISQDWTRSKEDLSHLYDLDLEVDSTGVYLTHSFYFQPFGISLSSKMAFYLEDGTKLDSNFMKYGTSTPGYVSTRCWLHFQDKTEGYVDGRQIGGKWYSDKYQEYFTSLDSSFDPKNMEYVFNQELQLTIKPPIPTPKNPTTFTIKKVIDKFNGVSQVLEDWSDGKWSHASDQTSDKALFDGVFGADPNGIFDKNGHLGSGSHQIDISLLHQTSSGMKNHFNIVIDKDPVNIEVSGSGSTTQKMSMLDQQGERTELYFSSSSIHFKVSDTDIKSGTSSLLASDGKWYEIPLNIKNVQVAGKWTQVIDSTMDYEGFAKIDIEDYAGNKKTIYLKSSKNKDAYPSVLLDKTHLSQTLQWQGSDVFVLNSPTDLLLTDPLASGITLSKVTPSATGVTETPAMSSVTDYKLSPPANYQFGKTVDNVKSKLSYAGDELKPFLSSLQQHSNWKTENKKIAIKTDGLYKLSFKTRLLEEQQDSIYIYLNQAKDIEPLDTSKWQVDKTNFKELPSSDKGPIDDIDVSTRFAKEMNIYIPQFLIKSTQVSYSLPWYSEFSIIDPNLFASKEGKYIIDIEDIFGVKHQYKFLLLDTTLSSKERDEKGIMRIMGDDIGSSKKIMLYQKSLFMNRDRKIIPAPGRRKKSVEGQTFWSGQNIFNYWRYEDKDHAIWEHNKFIDDALARGLSLEQAEWAYKHSKEDPTWDGNIDQLPNDESLNDMKEEYLKEQSFVPVSTDPTDGNNDFTVGSKKSISKGAIAGIVVASILFTGLVTITGIWLFRKRVKSKKLR